MSRATHGFLPANSGVDVDTDLGRNLILWTVRLSVALYCVAVWRYLSVRQLGTMDKFYSKAWSAAWLMCVIHVLCAYHFEHHWSQTAALKHTAEMTERVVGIHWAGGLYVNYVFLIVWGVDVARSFFGQKLSPISMHLTAAFMMFNATVVFGPRWWIAPTLLFAGWLFFSHRQQRNRAGSAV